MKIKNGLVILGMSLISFGAGANTIESAFWPTSPISQKLRGAILVALKERCPSGISDFGLKEDLTIIKAVDQEEGGVVRYYTTTFTSTYILPNGQKKNQSIDVETVEKIRDDVGVTSAEVMYFYARCPTVNDKNYL